MHSRRHAQEDSCGPLRDRWDAGSALEQESIDGGGSADRVACVVVVKEEGDDDDNLIVDLFFSFFFRCFLFSPPRPPPTKGIRGSGCNNINLDFVAINLVPQRPPPPLLLERRLPALWRPAAKRRRPRRRWPPRKPTTRPALHLPRQAAPGLPARGRHARRGRRRLLLLEGDRPVHPAQPLDPDLEGARGLARREHLRADRPGREGEAAAAAAQPPFRARRGAHRQEARRRGLGQRRRGVLEAHGGARVGVCGRGRPRQRQRDGRAR